VQHVTPKRRNKPMTSHYTKPRRQSFEYLSQWKLWKRVSKACCGLLRYTTVLSGRWMPARRRSELLHHWDSLFDINTDRTIRSRLQREQFGTSASPTTLQGGKCRIGFPMVSLEFVIDKILPVTIWPLVRLSF